MPAEPTRFALAIPLRSPRSSVVASTRHTFLQPAMGEIASVCNFVRQRVVVVVVVVVIVVVVVVVVVVGVGGCCCCWWWW